tara:strand:+ start:128 stop:505 length:378 start_codon:yes stop_codon:yes gene_type:complete
MSFKSVQNKIAKKSGVSKKAAGAILASASRNASPKAKKKNPKLLKVKGKSTVIKKPKKKAIKKPMAKRGVKKPIPKTKPRVKQSVLSQSVTRRYPDKAAKANAAAAAGLGKGRRGKPSKGGIKKF